MKEQKEIKINIPEGYEIDKENSSFEVIKFKKVEKELPKRWEDIDVETFSNKFFINSDCDIKQFGNIGKFIFDQGDNILKNVVPTRELAEAILALSQLLMLRDIYNDGWTPDWKDATIKYVIFSNSDCIYSVTNYNYSRTLAFKSEILRDEFLNNFKDLIEIAKPLL